MKLRDQLETQLLRDHFNVFPDAEINRDFSEDAIERSLARKQPAMRTGVFLREGAVLPPMTPPVRASQLLHDHDAVRRFVRDL